MDKLLTEHIDATKQAGLVGTAEFIQQLVNSNIRLTEMLRAEKSRNAFVEVTGKSLAEIRADAVNEMVFELTKSNFEAKCLNVSDIQQYADKLVESR